MAMIGQIAIQMTTDAKRFNAGLKGAQAQIQALGNQAKLMGNIVKVAMVGLATGAAAHGLGKMVMSASDLTETIGKTKATFGDASSYIIDQANLMNSAFGTSKVEFMDAASVLGGIFKDLGYGAGDAAKLSVAMVKLSDDVSSFKNLSFEEAFQKIRAGISGESEPLKSIGVLMDEERTKAQAYKMGLAKLGAELTQQQKVQARLVIIQESLKDAMGDHARTVGEVAGATRSLSGRFESLVQVMGQQLEPIAKSVLGELNVAITVLTTSWSNNEKAVTGMASGAVGALEQTDKSIGFVQSSIGMIADSLQTAKIGFYGFGAVALEIMSRVASAIELATKNINKIMYSKTVAFFFPALGAAYELFDKDQKKAIKDSSAFFGAQAAEMKDLSRVALEEMEKIKNAAPAHEGVNRMFEDARRRIKELQDKAAVRGDISGIKPGSDLAAKAAAKTTDLKFASAQSLGSTEGANTQLRSRYGASVAANKAPEKTAEMTTKMAGILEKMYQAQQAAKGYVTGLTPFEIT